MGRISLLLALVAALVVLVTLLLGGKVSLIFSGTLVLLGSLIWFVFAPSNIYFTFVPEGTAKIITVGDAFIAAVMQWQGRTFARYLSGEDRWTVVPEGEYETGRRFVLERDDQGRPTRTEPEVARAYEPWHLGGLRWIGLWPFQKVHIIHLRWHDIQRNAQGESPVFHDERMDYVLLRQDVYWTILPRAESGGEERIPLDVEFLTTMRVVNPYRATFVAPIGWIENVLLRLAPVYRGFVATHTLDQLLALRGKGVEIWEELGAAAEFTLLQQTIRDEWGIEIMPNGVQIKDISLPAEHQEAATKKWLAQREAERRAAETVGAVILMMAEATGKKFEEVQAEIQADPERQKAFLEMAKDLVTRQMAIDGRSFVDIRTTGGGLDQTLLKLAAAWQRMPGGSQERQERQPESRTRVPDESQRGDHLRQIRARVAAREEEEEGEGT